MIEARLRTAWRAVDATSGVGGGLERALQRGLQDLRSEIVRHWTTNANIATGNLRRSAAVITEMRAGELVGSIAMPAYAMDVEFGTGPHWVPLITPEGGGLLRWVIAKGLVRGTAEFKGKAKGRLSQAMGITLEAAQDALANPDASPKQRRLAKLRMRIESGDTSGRMGAMERRELQVAKSVQRAIAKRGTRAYPAIAPSARRTMPRILDLVFDALAKRGL